MISRSICPFKLEAEQKRFLTKHTVISYLRVGLQPVHFLRVRVAKFKEIYSQANAITALLD